MNVPLIHSRKFTAFSIAIVFIALLPLSAQGAPKGATTRAGTEGKSAPRVELPKFKKGRPERQKTTDSGLTYEVLKEGKGELLKEEQTFKLSYALFSPTGKLLDCSERSGREIVGQVGNMRAVFLQEGPLLMKAGARFRFEVPQKLGLPNASGTSVWELELLEVLNPLPTPEFARSQVAMLETTKSGLQYEIIKRGTGESPNATDSVRVRYAGWLADGTLFDSSYDRGEPLVFALSGVIAGWREGIQLMEVGAVYRFTIPADLAYGRRGKAPNIPSNATLVFHVELVEVQ